MDNKIIEEMAKVMCENDCEECRRESIELYGNSYDEDAQCVFNLGAERLYNAGYRKLPEDSVVLNQEEYERLSSSNDIVFCDNKDCPDNLLCRCCEISECPKNILEYDKKLSANKHKLALFQKLCKERERADSWEDRYKLLEEELKQSRKETAENIFSELYKKKIVSMDMRDNVEYLVFMKDILELAKQFGVEVDK